MNRFSLLDERVFSTMDRRSFSRSLLTLPGVLAALGRDDIDDFPALRPHQRHVWHAFLVQVAAIVLHRGGLRELPATETEWRAALLSLTPDDPNGAAWALVAPIDRPAFMQPPVPEGSLTGFKSIATPDDLDMLIAAKNHDVKRGSIRSAGVEHWVFALVSVQNQEGFMGAGNYGISRMNGGFASRAGVGIMPSGGVGRRFVRDATRLLELRPKLLEDYDHYPADDGRTLLWLSPWDGATAMSPSTLDPFYIEVCRRIRFTVDHADTIHAFAKGTKSARIDAKALKGRTGDGWTPLMADGAERKALTIDARSFGYKRITALVFPRNSDPDAPQRAPLQVIAPTDDREGLTLLARGMVRGQGKTEGYYERRIAVSPSLRRFLMERPTDEGAAIAAARVEDAGTLARKVLYVAVLTVFTAAPLEGERKRDDDTAKERAGRVLDLFDRFVDDTFFEALSQELAVAVDAPGADAIRARWLTILMEHARELLDQCARAAPSAAMRTYRTRARSRDVLEYAFRKHFGERVQNTTAPSAAATPSTTTPWPSPASPPQS